LDEKDTKYIGHYAWRLYSKMVEKFMEQIQKLEESWKVIEEQMLKLASSSNQESKKVLDEIINPLIKQVLNYKNKAKEFKDIVDTYSKEIKFESAFSQEALKKIQNILNEANDMLRKEALGYSVNNKIIESLNAWKELFDRTLNSISDPNLRFALTQILAQLTSQMETIFAFIKKQYSCYVRLGSCAIYSLFLSLTFSPHAVKSRYPEEGFNPLEVYTDKLPLIQMFKFFLMSAEVFLEDLENVLKCDFSLTIT